MKFIPLTQGQFAIIDSEDFEKVSKFKWYAKYNKIVRNYYAKRHAQKNKIRTYFKMPNNILNIDNCIIVDHVNHNTLDNRKINLRICTRAQNTMNSKKRRNSKVEFKGVTFNKISNKYRARITVDKKQIWLGSFNCKTEAAKIYDSAAKKYFGGFAYLNFR